MKVAGICLALAVGCGRGTPPAETPAPAPATAAALLPGTWVDAGSTAAESWVRVGDRLVGVGFAVRDGATAEFDVMIVHRRDADTVMTAMPGGRAQVDFTAVPADGAGELRFANPSHDAPKQIGYRRDGDALEVWIDGERTAVLRRSPDTAAAELEALDAAFASDSAARGGAAWAARFEPDGATWPYGLPRTSGLDRIAANIDEMRDGGMVLQWAPVASALSPAGDVGVTAGTYWITHAVRDSNTTGTGGTGIYVTVWRRDAAGDWKIAFDTGVAAPR